MAESPTEICNLALSNLGVGTEIQELDEDSAEAKACRAFYNTALKRALRDFEWPFATKIVDLSLVEEDPTDEYAYSYRYPSDCLFLRRILSGTRNETRQSAVHYRVVRDEDGLLLLTDAAEPQAEYTVFSGDDEPVPFYPADFVIAFSYLLASYIAPRIITTDPAKRADTMRNTYLIEASRAMANARMEEQPEEEPESEFIRARE